ncbi:MAG: sporulation protein YunB [Oscillibacter sp.]|nr:sporulation protein YunB [Oscillibacter sp.]
MFRFRFRYRGGGRFPLRLTALAVLATLSAVVLYAGAHLQPVLSRLAVARVSNTVNRIVIQSVDEAVRGGAVRYDQLISFEKDNDGRIAAIHSNMAACSRLQSEILSIILARLDEVPPRDLSIPLGTLLGSALLAGRGPRVSVRMESAGSSSARFGNTFTAAGINQTRHELVLYIDVNVAILLPGFTTATRVSNAVTVAETIIVGAVPETYTYFSTNPADGFDDQKDYFLNG